MLGIDPAQKDPLTPYLVNVKQTDLEPGKYNVILGEQLASQLGVNRGDQIRMMVPSASQFTPMGRIPSQRLFNVIGTFAANSEVDGNEMLVNIEDASRLMRYPAGNITGWRLWLDEPLKVDSLSQQKLLERSRRPAIGEIVPPGVDQGDRVVKLHYAAAWLAAILRRAPRSGAGRALAAPCRNALCAASAGEREGQAHVTAPW